MNTPEQTEPVIARDIDIEYEFSQSPAQVWRVLSEPELVAQWLAPGAIETTVGQQFSLQTTAGAVECEVLDSVPERLLSYSWRSSTDAGNLDTVVTFVLTETITGGTHLRLIHSGFIQATAQVIPFRAARSSIATSPKSILMPTCTGALSCAA